MNKRGRWIASILGGGIAAAVAVVAGAHWWLRHELGKEALIARMEESWNCRAHLDAADLELWSQPARLTLRGWKLAARDGEVSKPFGQRAALDPGAVEVSADSAVLELTLIDLLRRQLSVQKLLLSGVGMREAVDPDGNSSLSDLFKRPPSPDKVAAQAHVPTPSEMEVVDAVQQPPLAPVEPAKPVSTAAVVPDLKAPEASQTKNKADKPAKTFQVGDVGFALQVSEARVDKALIHILNRKAKTKVDISDLQFAFTDIDVDPSDLVHHNHCRLALSGQITVEGRARIGDENQSVTFADLHLKGEGDVRPFDPDTGLWSPASTLDLALAKGSTLAGHMTLGQTGSKDLAKLKDYGFDVSDVRVGGSLDEDAKVRIEFLNGRITLLSDARFVLPDYEFLVHEKSWLNGSEDQHEMALRLSCGPELEAKLLQGLSKQGLNAAMTDAVKKTFSDEKGRLAFDFISRDRLSKPKIQPAIQRALENLLKGGAIQDLLNGLIKGK